MRPLKMAFALAFAKYHVFVVLTQVYVRGIMRKQMMKTKHFKF